jgi:hypothetical protein
MASQSKDQLDGWTPRLAKLQAILVCPACRGSLKYHPSQAECTPCGKVYKVQNGKLYFVECATETDELDRMKGALKRLLGPRYPWLTGILGPTLLPNYTKLVDTYFPDGYKAILDVGCGNRRVRDDIIGIDVMDHAAVDIVCDMHQLPFRDATVDGIVSWNVIEHLPSASHAVDEMHRCLAEGASAIHEIPFLMPFHASPNDYARYTHQGAATLLAPCEVVQQLNLSGPFSLFCLIIAELFSVIFSFAAPRPRAFLFLVIAALLSPIKFLDLVLVGRQGLLGMAPTILTVVRKRPDHAAPVDKG